MSPHYLLLAAARTLPMREVFAMTRAVPLAARRRSTARTVFCAPARTSGCSGTALRRGQHLHHRTRRQRLERIAQGIQDQTPAFARCEPLLPVAWRLRPNGTDVVVRIEQTNRGV
ncbi:hypothetical protein SAMN05421783_110174 [Thiocapsa roseopersicina]|uniref:Uncharacterized protein n=1 Tax=Thiocapsa roseopersicina TaxID=1058 RepID=A0A1H2XH65_THIRO|nr:hypothetical protein SAMN05421783_110174 [Thiocapsa roseopersicina]